MSVSTYSQATGGAKGRVVPLRHDIGSSCPCEQPDDLNLAKHLLFDHIISPSLASAR